LLIFGFQKVNIGIYDNFVHFFLDWFQDSLKILNIRKMYFLLTLSVVMMGFLYIMHKLFPLPFSIPGI
jgi:DNA phosphorothioation-dependent restriction protein DptG